MDHSKIDAALAAALEIASDAEKQHIPVFVQMHEEIRQGDREALGVIGLPSAVEGGGTLTATLSPSQVAELSDRPSVRRIRLSGHLRLLPGQ